MRWIKRIAVWMFIAAGAWLIIVNTGMLPRISDEQRAAIVLLRDAPAPADASKNAYAAMWTLGYAVPVEQQEKVLAEDVARFAATRTPEASGQTFVSVAEGRYPKITPPADSDRQLCNLWETGCLTKVRAAHEPIKIAIDASAAVLERQSGAYSAEYFWDPFTPRLDSPLPNFGGTPPGRLPLTAAALRFVDGDQAGALTALCQSADFWRRMRSHTNSLIIDMIGVGYVSSAAQLYADMLAEMPPSSVLPDICQPAFALATTAELDQCNVYKHEFAEFDQLFREMRLETLGAVNGTTDSDFFARIRLLGMNREHTAALAANDYVAYCGPRAQVANAERDPGFPPQSGSGCHLLEKTFNPVGCALWEIATPSYREYRVRVLDLDARLRLLNTALWLRAQPGDAVREFDERRSELREAHHPMELIAERHSLRVKNLDARKGEWWEIALPASRVAATAKPTAKRH